MDEPSLEEIITARDQCAYVIAKYGERYLPIFERLEKEISVRENKQKLFEKAIQLGSKNGTGNGTENGTEII